MSNRLSFSVGTPSENPSIADTIPPHQEESAVLPFFTLATELLQQSQAMTKNAFLLKQKKSLQFSHKQCRYLVKKLEMAVHSARESMSYSSSRESSEVYIKHWKLIGKWKFLVRLAMDVQRFIEECCKEEHWIQAASMLINAFEHVVSLDSHLELCIWSFKNSGRIFLATALMQDLISISEAHDQRTGDLEKLLKKGGLTLKLENFGNLQGDELAASLLGKMEAALAINPVTIDQRKSLAELSVHDFVDLLKRVAAFAPKNLAEEQIATSLAPRYLVSVIDPFSENTDIDFMRVDCASLRRERKLGKGSFGEVYSVQWLGILAAQKVSIATELWSVFVKEVSMLARQSHPNIVRLLCYVKDDPNANQSKCSMLQELMQKDLTGLIEERMKLSDRSFPFSVEEVVDILLQIAEGMAYLHRRKVLHRDLKSQNILVNCEKREEIGYEYILAKVADFGISKTKEKTITLSQPTKNRGTPRWMAPEVIEIRDNDTGHRLTGDWNPDWNLFKCDVYSFGVLSYEILTGETPFVDDKLDKNARKKVLRGERPPLPLKYPFHLRSMIHKCWRGDPEERPTFAKICTELRFMKGALLIGWEL